MKPHSWFGCKKKTRLGSPLIADGPVGFNSTKKKNQPFQKNDCNFWTNDAISGSSEFANIRKICNILNFW